MGPETFGRELRRIREIAGLSLADISAETKISLSILRAMEAGKFQYLPGQVFSRNFVKQYAATVGSDEDRVAAWFDQAWKRYLADSGSHPVTLSLPPAPRPIFRWWVWVPMALIVLVVIAAGIAIWREKARSAAVAPVPRGALSTPVRTGPPPEPSPTVPGEASAGTAATAVSKLTILVRVKPGRECWIRYRDADGKSEQRFLHAEESLRLLVPPPVLLTLGNAAGVTVTVGGETYDDLGRPGQVVHLELTGSEVRRLPPGTRR